MSEDKLLNKQDMEIDKQDKEVEEMVRRLKARFRASASRGNILHVDPDNPFEIMRHQSEAAAFDSERLSLNVNILYVHGFASSGDSGTARTIQKYLPHCRVISPDVPVDPTAALKLLRKIVVEEKIDIVVGTSMGGMLAQKLDLAPKVLVNPAFHVSEFMRQRIGINSFFNQRADGATEFEVTPALCDAYQALESGQFDNLTDEERSITYGLFGTDDDVVSCESEYDGHYRNKMVFVGGHRLTDEAVHDYVVEAILQLCRGMRS